jgi:hypothetical protein
MIYAVQGGLTDEILQDLNIDIDGAHDELLKIFERLNKFTHVRPGSLIADDEEFATFMERALSVVLGFHETLSSTRDHVGQALSVALNDEAFDSLTESAIDELDELSTHTFVEEVVVDEVAVTGIDAEHVHIQAGGTVYVTLNYGSSSDFRRGDGVSLNDRYPFAMTARADVDDLSKIRTDRPIVNNESFFANEIEAGPDQ